MYTKKFGRCLCRHDLSAICCHGLASQPLFPPFLCLCERTAIIYSLQEIRRPKGEVMSPVLQRDP